MNDPEILEIKQRYGDRAKDDIIADLHLSVDGQNVSCPWPDHGDSTPSAIWNEDKKHFHCFLCPKQYDIINHWQEHKHLSPADAIQGLKKDLGIISTFESSTKRYYSTSDYNLPPPPKSSVPPPNPNPSPIPEPQYSAKKEAPEQDLNSKLHIYNGNYNKYEFEPLDSEQEFFKHKKIRCDVAKEYFDVESGITPYHKKLELLFHCYSVDEYGKILNVLTKRRNADNTLYEPKKDESDIPLDSSKKPPKLQKEISIFRGKIAQGISSLFGLKTLYNNDGSFKDVAILCEGIPDALRCASEIVTTVEDDRNDSYLPLGVLSVPNGSNSLKSALIHNPIFWDWYNKHCKLLIILPDADFGRIKMLADAKELPDSDKKVRWFDLTVIPGIDYRIKKGQDASDALDILNNEWGCFFDVKQLQQLPIDDLIIAGPLVPKDGLRSGNVTEDYNNTGMKGLTCKAGADGQGKTTEMRKKIIQLAQQKIKSYVYFGEGKNVDHLRDMHLAASLEDERFLHAGLKGDGISKTYANQDGIDRYNRDYAPYITLCDQNPVRGQSKLDTLLQKMEQHAKQGCEAFFIDNLNVILDTTYTKSNNDAYGYTCQKLKDFTDEFNVMTYLLHHMLKDGTDVYGASHIRNIVDTLCVYRRLDDHRLDPKYKVELIKTILLVTKITDAELETITAVEYTYKIRDRGQVHMALYTWNEARGCAEELVWNPIMNRMATHYIEMGFPCEKASTLLELEATNTRFMHEQTSKEIIVVNTTENHTADNHTTDNPNAENNTTDNHTTDNHTSDKRSSKKEFFQDTIRENEAKQQKYQEEQAKIRKVD